MIATGEPSGTAMTAAAARAAHLIVDRPPYVFADTLAATLLGERAEELLAYHRHSGTHPILAGARAQVTCRSRYTEARLAARVADGLDQYVILGAGLDSFAYRSPLAGRVRVFEVDHPSTQAWKRGQLARAGIQIPPDVAFVPLDLEAGDLAGALVAAGFDATRPALVSWLGVSMYLTRDAIGATLDTLSRLAPGSELVLDYLVPEELRDRDGLEYARGVAAVAAERGEPWLTFLTPDGMAELLRAHGLEPVEQTQQRDLFDAGLWPREDALRPSNLGRLALARRP